ncbi:MAG: tetratricopeptide repeat protein [Candidatus Omnitrophota bacterium]|nr:tetratricopeptide repeat protein [Candidatus Omnitrophota bacterium]
MNKKFLLFVKIACLSLFLFGIITNFSYSADNKEDELFFVAQKAFEDGFYDVALRYLEKFLKDFPETNKRAQVNLLIGQCYFFENQYLKAFDVFQGLLGSAEAKEIRDAVFFWMGETYLKGKDYKQAKEFYQQLINEFPKSTYLAQANYSLAWAFFEEGFFQQALDTFTKLTKGFKHSDLQEDANFKIGECLYNLRQYDKSRQQFTTFLSNYPLSLKRDLAYFYIGEANYYLDDLNAALENYAKAISLTQDAKIKSLAKISCGWALLKLNKYDESLKNFEGAEAFSKENGLDLDDILLGKGNLFLELDQLDKALGFYDELIISYPYSLRLPDAYLGKANVLYRLSKYQESADTFKLILKRFSEDNFPSDLMEKAYFGLGWVNLKLGRPLEAIENFKNIANSSQDKMMRLSALCQMADAYQDTGVFPEALAIYDRILKDFPDSVYSDYVQYQEGIVLLKMDKIDAATLMFQILKTNFPKSKFIPDAQYYLGSAYFKKRDFTSCVEQFTSLIKTLPGDSELRPEAIFNLGLALSHLERYKEAIDIFERIAKEYPLTSDLVQRAEFEIANTMFNQGKVKDALKKFKIILYKYPKTKIGLETIYWLGDYYLKDKKFDLAIKYFRQIIDDYRDTDMVNAGHYNLGRAFLEMGNFSEAMKELDKVDLTSNPQLVVDTKFAKARVLTKTDLNTAIKAYESIALDYPDFSKLAFIKLAQIYKSQGDSDKAVTFKERALTAKYIATLETTDAQIQFEIADLMESKGDLNKAIEGYLKVTYLYPDENFWVVKSYLRVARIFEDKNDWQEAKKIYEKIATSNIEEAKFAQERLDWINRNLKN